MVREVHTLVLVCTWNESFCIIQDGAFLPLWFEKKNVPYVLDLTNGVFCKYRVVKVSKHFFIIILHKNGKTFSDSTYYHFPKPGCGGSSWWKLMKLTKQNKTKTKTNGGWFVNIAKID